MATTNEWYQRSVRDYEDKVRDYSADLAFLNEQIRTANDSIAFLRRQRTLAAGNDEEVQQLTDTINNVTSRRNGLELRQADTQQSLTQAQNSLSQAEADLARVNQGAQAQTLPEQPPSAPAADPAARQAQAPVTSQNTQVVATRNAADVTDPGEIPGVTVSDRLQTDPGEVPGETVFGASFAADTGGVPTQQLRDVPTPVPAQQPEFDEFPETINTDDTFAGNGYGFVYDEDGELIPADSADAERIQSESAQPVDPFAFDEGSLEIPQDPQGFNESDLVRDPEPVDPFAFDEGSLEIPQDPQGFDEGALDQAGKEVARDQFTLQQRNNTTTQGDWRVRIRLLPGASYLYRDSANYLLQPLRDSDGVVFPYVPTITTNYVARYDPYELVHANYRGFFYKNSHVGEIQINGTFTAQDTAEASYLLAVIHFFRSCTKMFYGQDSEFRGSPPPLVELSGYGEFQFNNHPCLVSNFNYTLPNGVDYIRVSPNNQGVNLSNRRNPISTGGITLDSVINRLTNNNLVRGAEPGRIDLGFSQGVNGTGQTTYVPTKMEIQLTLLPTQTREQVSKGFRLDEFARGNLLRGGFW